MTETKFTIICFLTVFTKASAFWETHGDISNQSLIDAAINVFDENNDGKITGEENKGKEKLVAVLIRNFDKDDEKAVDRFDLEKDAREMAEICLALFDFNDDGTVTKKEMQLSSTLIAFPIKGLTELIMFLFDFADFNGDGTISQHDYKISNNTIKLFKHPKTLEEKTMSLLLKTMDKDDNLKLNKDELSNFFKKVMNKIDKDGDGKVTLQELTETMDLFKFPHNYIDGIKQEFASPKIARFSDEVQKVIFKEIDTDHDEKINAEELSNLITKPLPNTLIDSMKDAHKNLTIAGPTISISSLDEPQVDGALLLAVSSFLQEPEFASFSMGIIASLSTSTVGFCLAFIICIFNN